MGEFGPVGLLQFSVMAISLLFVVIFFIAWLNFGRKKHALIWSLAFFASALEWLLNLYVGDIVLMQGHLGALVSLLTISTVSLAFLGHRQRVGLSTNLGVLLSGGLLVEAAVVWFSLYEIHAGIRQSIVPGYGYFLLSWSAITIVIKSRERNPAVWGAGAAIMMFACTLLLSVWVALQQGVTESEQYTRIFNVLIFTAMPSAFVAMGLFSVLLIASDMAQDLKEHSILDMLTRTLNRRGIEEAIRPAFAQARRYAQPLAVVMTDIDFFKAINDDYGHVTGDNALTMFADILKSQLRTEDIVGRMGGEEFIIVLPNTDSEKAHLMIERLRRVIASTLITSNEYKFNMTASFGLTLLTDEDEDMEDAIRRADEALYIAKERGRNRIEFG